MLPVAGGVSLLPADAFESPTLFDVPATCPLMAETEAAATIPDAAVAIIKSLLFIICFSLHLRA